MTLKLRKLRPHFGIVRHGISLAEYTLRRTIDVGITIETQLGIVPEFEEREAAVYTLCDWSKWCELTSNERAFSIAHYRLHLAIEAHINDAVDKHHKRAAAKGGKRGHR